MGKFIILFLSAIFFAQSVFAAEKVALHIYIHDGFAFSRQSEDLFERMFADLRPELKFRRISISPDELKDQISSALSPDEELAVLIIDTHGGTEESDSGEWTTSLRHLGKAGAGGVDPDFENTFYGLKGKATNDLQIILNSCSVFCGGEESAALRAKSILDFFGAEDGSIYGSEVNEVSHAFDDRKYFKWKYLIPDFKMVATVAGVTTALLFPVVGYADYQAVQEQGLSVMDAVLNASLKSVSVGAGLAGLATVGAPVTQKILSKYFLNRGYFFSFTAGKLSKSYRVIKYKDLKKLIGCANFLK